jgi:hypothetical protein
MRPGRGGPTPAATLFPARRFPASMEEYFKALTLWLASGSEAAALVIGLATIEATLRAVWLFVKGAFPRVGI